MSPAHVLKMARDAGVHVGIDGDDLALEASVPPPPAVLDLLSRHKPGIVALLRPSRDNWSVDDWRAFFDERAGIAEFDGGLPRERAAARAFDCCVGEWLNRNPVRSPPDRCLGCGGVEHTNVPLLPFGTEISGHAWLHHRCWSAWYTARRAEAVAVLAAMGVEERSIHP